MFWVLALHSVSTRGRSTTSLLAALVFRTPQTPQTLQPADPARVGQSEQVIIHQNLTEFFFVQSYIYEAYQVY